MDPLEAAGDFCSCPNMQDPRRQLRAEDRGSQPLDTHGEGAAQPRFQDAYRVALQQWLAGLTEVFPVGTYKMRGKPGVLIQE